MYIYIYGSYYWYDYQQLCFFWCFELHVYCLKSLTISFVSHVADMSWDGQGFSPGGITQAGTMTKWASKPRRKDLASASRVSWDELPWPLHPQITNWGVMFCYGFYGCLWLFTVV